MNVFKLMEVAKNYDCYYGTEIGSKIDRIEKNIISELTGSLHRDKILEIGCGTGHWTEYFNEEGFDVTAIDVSEPMLKIAAAKKINASFVRADANHIPISSESYSYAASITMLEFVDDRDLVLSEIFRILKPGGYLILGCLNGSSILGKDKDKDSIFREANFFSIEELKNKLEAFGETKLLTGVYLTDRFKIADGSAEAGKFEPAFVGATVKKRSKK